MRVFRTISSRTFKVFYAFFIPFSLLVVNSSPAITMGLASRPQVVTGTGSLASSSPKKEALHAALRAAVEQAVGVQITSETIVRNSSLLTDKIYARAEGFVEKWEILRKTTDNQLLVLEVKAWVKEGRLNKALFLNGIDVQKVYDWVGNPRILFIVEEYIDGQPSQVNIAQTELEEIFKNKGITVLGAEQIENIKKRDAKLVFDSPEQAKILGNRLGAEIVVAGKCLSNFSRQVKIGDYTQCFYSAYIQIKAYNTSTGEILLSSHYKNDKKADLSALGRFDASMKAIRNCIQSAKSDIVFKIVRNWYDCFTKPTVFQLFIQDITYEKVQKLNQHLYALGNCRDLFLRSFEHNIAEIEIKYEGIRSELVNKILNAGLPLAVDRETQNRIFLKFIAK